MTLTNDEEVRAFALQKAIDVTNVNAGGPRPTGWYLSTARSFYDFLTGREPKQGEKNV